MLALATYLFFTANGLVLANIQVFEEPKMILKTETDSEKQARLAWWKEARFGMFVHWGLYSITGGEWDDVQGGTCWIQREAGVAAAVYADTLMPQFNPAPDFAHQWARLAKQAGAKYVVFTNKHHDGFALHESAETDFDAKEVTGRDLHQEIVDGIRREGLKVGVYHSLWDWHHPDAPAGEGALNIAGLTMEGRNLSRYRDYLYAQVNEITDGRYGPVDIMWLDFSRNQYQGEAWGAKALVEMIRRNQPEILINNRLWRNEKKSPEIYEKYWTGDFSTPEQHIPANGIEGIDWETCDTLNGRWGWSTHDMNYKTPDEVIQRLIDAVSKGGNYLLNIGPLPDGSIDPKTVAIFTDVGHWMRVNNEAIYGTQAGPFTRLPWGRATSKNMGDGTHRLYLHVFEWPEQGNIHVPGLQTEPVRAFVVGDNVTNALEISAERGGIRIKGLSAQPGHSAATVLALDFSGKPEVAPFRVVASDRGIFTLEAADALIEGAKYHDHEMTRRSCLDTWTVSGRAVYPLQVDITRDYKIELELAADQVKAGDQFALRAGDVEVLLELRSTGGANEWERVKAGSIRLPVGAIDLELLCLSLEGESAISIGRIILKP